MKPYYEHVGERMRERMISLKYVKPDGEPDVERFSWDFRFSRTNLYNWLGNEAAPFKDLIRLCEALDCSAEWLLTGKERDPKAQPGRARRQGQARKLLLALSAGALALWPSGSTQAHPLSVVLSDSPAVDALRLIGSWRRFRNNIRGFGPGTAYAT